VRLIGVIPAISISARDGADISGRDVLPLMPWISAKAHLSHKDDELVKAEPLLSIVPNRDGLLASGLPDADKDSIKMHGKTGRPLGNQDFPDSVEKMTG